MHGRILLNLIGRGQVHSDDSLSMKSPAGLHLTASLHSAVLSAGRCVFCISS
jgi:hypothetical protein